MPLLPCTPFQQVARQWDAVCPQNSAQAMLVEGQLDGDLIETAWQSTLRDMGVGVVHMNADAGGYSHEIWSGNPPAPLVSQPIGQSDIYRYLQAELDRAFPASPSLPYRAFAIQRDNDCYLGIVYQQWVADSVAIRLMMREWFVRIFNPSKARRKLIDLPRARIVRGPDLDRTPLQAYRAAKHIWRWMRGLRQTTSFKPGHAEAGVELRSISLPSESLDGLLLLARAEGCTINDLLIAALAASLGPVLVSDASTPITIAIATSVDLRPYLPGDLSETFGSLLAYVPIVCPLPAANKLDLAQEIARQTRQLKDPEYIAQYLLVPRLMAWRARGKRPDEFAEYYRKHAAVAAGVANVNLTKSWPALFHPNPLKQYVRVAAPNPAMPISVSASTLGDKLDIVISSQLAALASDMAEQVTVDFARTLKTFVQSRNANQEKNNG